MIGLTCCFLFFLIGHGDWNRWSVLFSVVFLFFSHRSTFCQSKCLRKSHSFENTSRQPVQTCTPGFKLSSFQTCPKFHSFKASSIMKLQPRLQPWFSFLLLFFILLCSRTWMGCGLFSQVCFTISCGLSRSLGSFALSRSPTKGRCDPSLGRLCPHRSPTFTHPPPIIVSFIVTFHIESIESATELWLPAKRASHSACSAWRGAQKAALPVCQFI